MMSLQIKYTAVPLQRLQKGHNSFGNPFPSDLILYICVYVIHHGYESMYASIPNSQPEKNEREGGGVCKYFPRG